MKFPTLKGEKTAYFPVEALDGGCNLRDGNRAADGQLAAANNVWWYNGALRTRPVFSAEEIKGEYFQKRRVTWYLCPEDTVKGQVVGRRFLRSEYNTEWFEENLTVGVLTYDGRILYEGSVKEQLNGTEAVLMEYPYTADENVLMILSNDKIFAQNSNGKLREVTEEAYVPCILTDGQGVSNDTEKPSVPGKRCEEFNMLTDRFCARYTATGTGAVFHLPYKPLRSAVPITISVNFSDVGLVEYVIPPSAKRAEEEKNGFLPYVDRTQGTIRFCTNMGSLSPLPEGEPNNVTIIAGKERGVTEKLLAGSMTFSTWFGGSRAGCDSRQILSGSWIVQNRIYWSEPGQPLYFPETNYMAVGDINQPITAIGKQDGDLIVFKENEIYSLSGEERTLSHKKVDSQLAQESATDTGYFTLTRISGNIGCKAPRTVVSCNGRLCWADGAGGVYTLIHDTSGYKVKELSGMIAPHLKTYEEEAWQNASGALYKEHYLLQLGNTIYVLRVGEKAFRQYANAYNEGEAQQNLVWYIWTLPDTYKLQFLCGNGSKVSGVIERPCEEDPVFSRYQLPLYIHQDSDTNYGTDFESEEQIPVSFATKEYDFGMPFARKRMLRVYLGLKTFGNANVTFSYLRDGTECADTRCVSGETAGELILTPNVAPVRRGGFILRGVGKIAVDSLAFTYR